MASVCKLFGRMPANTGRTRIRSASHRSVGATWGLQTPGLFKHIKPVSTGLTSAERELLELRSTGDTLGFLRRAVQLDKVIVVAGETGSGKTTFMKALMQEIPRNQRLITIEDTPELFLPDHPNHVHLFYKSEANEEDGAIVTPASLLKSCLRMKPTRILLAELRSGETYDFLNVAASGHRGSITSVHAGSCDLAFERLALMVLQNRQGRQLPYPVIRRLLHLVVDVVVHITNDTDEGGFGRNITELWYDPVPSERLARSRRDVGDSHELARSSHCHQSLPAFW